MSPKNSKDTIAPKDSSSTTPGRRSPHSRLNHRLFTAVTPSQHAMVEEILRTSPALAEQSDAIVWAVRRNQPAICELLIRHGCNIRPRSVALSHGSESS